MILSRLLSILFRFAQFVCAAVVLGLTAWFLDQRPDGDHSSPFARVVYTIIWSALSVLAAVFLMIPFTSSIINYTFDFIMSAGWFAAFGLLVDWLHDSGCGGAFHWSGIADGGYCDQWRAAEAFSFLSAIFWFASMFLGILVYHRLSTTVVTTDAAPRRRRGFFRRTYV